MCSDIEEPEITDINVCKEAQKWLNVYEFIDKSDHPSPILPSGCIYWENPKRVIWNPVQRGTPHEAMSAICLNSSKYILVYHPLSQNTLYIIKYLKINYYVFICFKDPDVTTLPPPPPPPPPPPGITTLRYS